MRPFSTLAAAIVLDLIGTICQLASLSAQRVLAQDGSPVPDTPTSVIIPADTDTPIPILTDTPIPIPTDTPAPPTHTSIPPTHRPNKNSTPIPTATHTSTPRPTNAPTWTPTQTATTVPTATITRTPFVLQTGVPSGTPSPDVSQSPTITPSATETALNSATAIARLSATAGPFAPTSTSAPAPNATVTSLNTTTDSPRFAPVASVQARRPFAGPLPMSDDFESGNLDSWTKVKGLQVQADNAHSGTYAARATSNGTAAYARETLPETQKELNVSVAFKVVSQGDNSVYLLRYRTRADKSLLGIFVNKDGRLGYRNDVVGNTETSTVVVTPGVWHVVQVHAYMDSVTGNIEVWLDGTQIVRLANHEGLGPDPVGIIQIGENATGGSFDVAFDDVVFDSKFIEPATPTPTAHSSLLAERSPTATGAEGTPVVFEVSPLASPEVSATPYFADGFESGNLSRWSKTKGMVTAQSAAMEGTNGARAVSSNEATYVRKSLPAPVTDLYYRTYLNVANKSNSTVYLMRCRTVADESIVGVYLNGSGRLGYRNDVTGRVATGTYVIEPGGWHEIQIHVSLSGAGGIVEVWLDGIKILSNAETFGSTPIGIVQLGENDTGSRTYDIAYDDVAVSPVYVPPEIEAPKASTAPTPALETSPREASPVDATPVEPTPPPTTANSAAIAGVVPIPFDMMAQPDRSGSASPL